MLRDFFWTNDREYLNDMWPSVKKAINYILQERDVTNDSMPYISGSNSSYDNFPMYGFAAYIVSVWLAAINSAVEAARAIGDKKAEKSIRRF